MLDAGVEHFNHRIKNALETVHALSIQAMHSDGIVLDWRKALKGRLLALSHAHGHLSRVGRHASDLHNVLQEILAPFSAGRGERIWLDGPSVKLPAQHMVTLELILHELATNAARFGALSIPDGYVSVSWRQPRTERAANLMLCWREHQGPAVGQPQCRGFGTRFIERAMAQSGGAAMLIFDPAGLQCDMEMPLPQRGDDSCPIGIAVEGAEPSEQRKEQTHWDCSESRDWDRP